MILCLTVDFAPAQDQPATMPLAILDDLSYYEKVWGMKKVSYGAEMLPPTAIVS